VKKVKAKVTDEGVPKSIVTNDGDIPF